jgi:hypothetical protein
MIHPFYSNQSFAKVGEFLCPHPLSEDGKLEIEVPRDRTGEFDPHFIRTARCKSLALGSVRNAKALPARVRSRSMARSNWGTREIRVILYACIFDLA